MQIDSVNVLSRSHYLPVLQPAGPAIRGRRSTRSPAGGTTLFEYWAHEASFLPGAAAAATCAGAWPRRSEHAWGNMVRIQRERPEYVRRGPRPGPRARAAQGQRARRAAARPARARCGTGTPARSALEWLFFTGALTARAPHDGFERVYDLTERVLPADVAAGADARPGRRHPRAGAHRRPGAGRGDRDATCATTSGSRAGRRPARRSPSSPTPASCSRSRSPAGARPAWLDPEARRPRWIRARALLSPFDSLVWERPRVERIFGFRYRLEIYTPAAKRVHGYYVLPFLLGDQLVARVDLKADRQAGVLRVQAAHAEEGVDRALVAAALADELRLMADWLELDEVEVARPRAIWRPTSPACAAARLRWPG